MKSIKLVFLYGFFVWLIPFIVAFLIFPIRETDRPLFESIMPVIVTLRAVLFSILYFLKVDAAFFKEGTLLGIVWFLISVMIDLLDNSLRNCRFGFHDSNQGKESGVRFRNITEQNATKPHDMKRHT